MVKVRENIANTSSFARFELIIPISTNVLAKYWKLRWRAIKRVLKPLLNPVILHMHHRLSF